MLLSEIVKLQTADDILIEGLIPQWLSPIASKIPKTVKAILVAAALIGANAQAATPEQLLQAATVLNKIPEVAFSPVNILKNLKASPRFSDIPKVQLAKLADMTKQSLISDLKKEYVSTVQDEAGNKRERDEVAHVAAEEFDKMLKGKGITHDQVMKDIADHDEAADPSANDKKKMMQAAEEEFKIAKDLYQKRGGNDGFGRFLSGFAASTAQGLGGQAGAVDSNKRLQAEADKDFAAAEIQYARAKALYGK